MSEDQTPARPKGAVRGRGNDPVTITNNQLTNWAARIARLAWSAEDDTAHGKAIALAMEMKALTDAAPSSVQGDTTPATPDDEPATVSLCGVPHRISCNLVTEADEQWCTCDGPQRVGEALLARLNSLSSVQDSESSCSCVHAPERHGSNAGGCIECPCRATSKDEGHRND